MQRAACKRVSHLSPATGWMGWCVIQHRWRASRFRADTSFPKAAATEAYHSTNEPRPLQVPSDGMKSITGTDDAERDGTERDIIDIP